MNDAISNPEIKRLSFTTDDGAGDRARIGLLVLESDQTMEWEFRALTDLPGVSLYHTRLANDITVTPDTLAKMEHELPKAAALIPQYLDLSAIGYGCTSGATIIGEDRVARICDAAHPGVPATNPLSAAKAALKVLGVKRLGLLTPYAPDVTIAMQTSFAADGINVTTVGSFYEDNDTIVGKIDSASLFDAILAVGAGDCDGVFVSCTSLRTASLIAKAEARLGKPVTASNHALAWHLLRLAGITDRTSDKGRLFDLPLAETIQS